MRTLAVACLIANLVAHAANGAAPQPSFICTPLAADRCTSSNPVKKWFFSSAYQPYEITITNPTPQTLFLDSATSTPRPLSPERTKKKLSQSKSFMPWLIGAGWSATLISFLGLAIVPSVVIGTTIVIAGTIGMRNNPLPDTTQHTLQHLLLDGIHIYEVQPYSSLTCVVILPVQAATFTLYYRDSLAIEHQHRTIVLRA